MIDGSSTTEPNTSASGDPIKIDVWSVTVTRQPVDAPLDLSVRITNVSQEPILMVGVVPGSEGLRYPHYLVEIEGPAGPVGLQFPEALDYVRGLRSEDFCRLAPGESFDPQGKGFIPIQQLAWFKPTKPGQYRLRVCFDATARDPREWMGHTPVPVPREVERLIRQVPPIRVWSNTLAIDFE